MVIEPSSRFAYISNIYGNDVAVLDIAARKVVKTISSGAGPNGISFSPLAPAPASSTQVQLPMPEHQETDKPGMNMP